MSQREKILAFVVGGVFVLLLNLFVIRFFLNNHTRLTADLAQKRNALEQLELLFTDRALWERRNEWIQSQMPRLGTAEVPSVDAAGPKLLEQVKEVARKHSVLITPETLGIATPIRKPEYTAVRVNIETKSSWKDLIAFLNDLQGPEKFIVFETANLKVDSGDQTKMHGRFRIAKWYSPEGAARAND